MLMTIEDLMILTQKSREITRALTFVTGFPKPILVRGKTKYYSRPQVLRFLATHQPDEPVEMSVDEMLKMFLVEEMIKKSTSTQIQNTGVTP